MRIFGAACRALLALLALSAGPMGAQEPAPADGPASTSKAAVPSEPTRGGKPIFPGVLRGVLLERDATLAAEFSLRAASNQIYRFTFDAKTYVESEGQGISMAGVQTGDIIEVVGDRDENAAVHYARTVHVIAIRRAPRPPVAEGKYRLYQSPIEFLAPRGDLTFSGVVIKLNADRLVLHTRLDGEKTILLRGDTRYIASGSLVDVADLKPSIRVFVRAGKDLDDKLEAYQIVWGEILEPSRAP